MAESLWNFFFPKSHSHLSNVYPHNFTPRLISALIFKLHSALRTASVCKMCSHSTVNVSTGANKLFRAGRSVGGGPFQDPPGCLSVKPRPAAVWPARHPKINDTYAQIVVDWHVKINLLRVLSRPVAVDGQAQRPGNCIGRGSISRILVKLSN